MADHPGRSGRRAQFNGGAGPPPAGQLPIERLEVEAYTIPTDAPEADGTLAWDSTTIVVVHARSAGERGLGYTYADLATAKLIESKLAGVVLGRDAMAAAGGLGGDGPRDPQPRPARDRSMAIAAVDVALWDLKARLLGLPLGALLGRVRDSVPVYGSGGFTAYPIERLGEQLAELGGARHSARQDEGRGRSPGEDPDRVARAREAIGPDAELFVDANGAYSRKQALALAERFRASRACAGSRSRSPPTTSRGCDCCATARPPGCRSRPASTATTAVYFERMLEAGAVDVLQADVTRCAGITELLRVDALCRARSMPLSLHCGPASICTRDWRLGQLVHLEYFHDHVRIEQMLFDGVVDPASRSAVPGPRAAGQRARAEASRCGALCGSVIAFCDVGARRPSECSPGGGQMSATAAPSARLRARRRSARCRSGSRSTSSTSGARSATSGCGRRSRCRRR